VGGKVDSGLVSWKLWIYTRYDCDLACCYCLTRGTWPSFWTRKERTIPQGTARSARTLAMTNLSPFRRRAGTQLAGNDCRVTGGGLRGPGISKITGTRSGWLKAGSLIFQLIPRDRRKQA
jgi:hypothetical protein